MNRIYTKRNLYNIGMRIIKEVGVGLEKDNSKTIMVGMKVVAVVDLDQVHEQVQIEIEQML